MNTATKTALLCLFVAGCAVQLSDELDLVNFSKAPDAVDVTGQAQTVTCTMNIPDGAGGGGGDANTVRYAACSFKSPQGQRQGCLATNAIGDDWSCPVTIPADSEANTWVLEYVFAENLAGNKLFATGAEIEADQSDGEIDLVVASTLDDTTPPVITSFTALPAEVDPGSTLTCTVVATDVGGSGVKTVGCSLVPDNGTSSISCVAQDSSTCDITIPVGVDFGVTYGEINHFARDAALNVTVSDAGRSVMTRNQEVDPIEWPQGPADTCTLDALISASCVCEGSVYTTGYCCAEGYSYSACGFADPANIVYVTPDGTGDLSGTDWSNTAAFPSSFTRGKTYMLAAGNYGTSVRNFTTAASGTSPIMLRKATAALHGTETGWVAGLGTGQATFGALQFSTDYWILDGGELNGIRSTPQGLWQSGGVYSAIELDGDHMIVRNTEVNGNFAKANENQTVGSCHGIRSYSGHEYVVMDRVEVHNVADDALELIGLDYGELYRSKLHDLKGYGTDYCEPAPVRCGPCNNGHSDAIELTWASNYFTAVGNVTWNIDHGTGALIVQATGGGTQLGHKFYNNVFFSPNTGHVVQWQHNDGSEFHNNVVWGTANPATPGDPCRYGGMWIDGDNVTDFDMSNNVLTCVNFTHGGGAYDPLEHNMTYNLYGSLVTSEYPGTGTGDIVSTPSESTGTQFFVSIPYSEDPADLNGIFTGYTDFTTNTEGPAANNGTALGGTYDFDMKGLSRPQGPSWDMGAFDVATSTWPGFGGQGGAGGAAGTGGAGGAGGAPFVCSATADYATGTGWSASTQETSAAGVLTFEFYMRVGTAAANALIAIDDAAITDFADTSLLVRFNTSNELQVRNAGTYECSPGPCPSYVPDQWYRFVINADVVADTYTVEYETCEAGASLQTLHDGAAFRNSATSLDYHAAWTDGAVIEVDAVSWADNCTPLTCVGAGYECGTPSDGCGGTLSCGSCGGGEVCDSGTSTCCVQNASFCSDLYTPDKDCGSWPDNCGVSLSCGDDECGDGAGGDVCVDGVCCTPSATVCTDPDPDYECGDWADGCGGQANCGTCPQGEACNGSGQCVVGTDWWDVITRPTAANTGPYNEGVLSPANAPPRNIRAAECAAQPNCTWEDFTSSTIDVYAQGVTLRNFRITGGLYGLHVNPGGEVTVEYGEFTGADSACVYSQSDITMRYSHIHDCETDGIKVENAGLLENNFCEKLGNLITTPDGHADCLQSKSANGVIVRHNDFQLPCQASPNYPGSPYKCNAAYIIENSSRNVLVEENWLNGGHYTIYWNSATPDQSIEVRNNLFGRDYDCGSGRYCPNGECVCTIRDPNWSGGVRSGNRWEDTKALVY